jgi:3',5'-cyclic AMP phosphodiesterase CpdA
MSTPSLLATSDLHVSHRGNRAVAERIRPRADGDWLLVAGDVADTVADVEWTLRLLRDRFEKVIWTPGNHELWTTPHDEVRLRGAARYEHLVGICRELGVVTPEDPYPVWTTPQEQLVVVPLFLLYDYSWRPRGTTIPEALADARAKRVVCTDEFFLHPDPYPTRQDWADHRLTSTLLRLEQLPPGQRTVLVSHWPLHRAPTKILHWQHFAMWCGMERTQDWHRRFRAAAAVYGHLHIPMTTSIDGVRFDEVSLGYPREWRQRSEHPDPVRSIVPPEPGRRAVDHRLLTAYARTKRKGHLTSAVTGVEPDDKALLRAARERLYRIMR